MAKTSKIFDPSDAFTKKTKKAAVDTFSRGLPTTALADVMTQDGRSLTPNTNAEGYTMPPTGRLVKVEI